MRIVDTSAFEEPTPQLGSRRRLAGQFQRAEDTNSLWALAYFCAVLTPLISLFSGYQKRAFDSYVHMFFADHYARGWFETWEPRWYGGFDVTSYPPLAHQLVALLLRVFSHEVAFCCVMGAAMLAIPLIAGRFARDVAGERAGAWTTFLIALWPTTHRFAYVYGQLAMIVATPFALLAMRSIRRYAVTGNRQSLLLGALWMGATSGAHHVSTIFAIGGAGAALLAASAQAKSFRDLWSIALRGGVALGLGLLAVIVSIEPFLHVAAQSPQTEIPHISRDPLWIRPFSMELVEHWVHPLIALTLLLASLVRRNWPTAVLALAALVLATVATGRSTPVPQLLFRAQASWLTYDKFHFWCAILLAMAVGSVLPAIPLSRMQWVAPLLVGFPMYLCGHKSSDSLQPTFIHNVSPLLDVLNGPDAKQFSHLTLGFGDQFCRLSFLGQSPNIDGDYHTARSSLILRESGIGTLDATKYYPQGPDILKRFFEDNHSKSLRWVFSYDDWYNRILYASGFQLIDVWPNGVSLFERQATPLSGINPVRPRRLGLHWGTVPLLFLSLAAVLEMKRMRQQAT